MTKTKTNESAAAVSARSVRAIRPSDVAALSALDLADRWTLTVLVERVVERVARLAVPDAADVASMAALTVARHYAVTGDVDKAVNRAVALARQAVKAAGSDRVEVPFDPTDGDKRARLETWQATRPDSIAQTNDQREAFRALLARAGEDVSDRWEAIAEAWLQHDERQCARCAREGARPGSLTLTSIRAHVSGVTRETASARYYAMGREDRATCEAVRDVLAPMARDAADRGPVLWDADRDDLWATFGLAWAMVEHGDRGEAFVRPTAPVSVSVRTAATVETPAVGSTPRDAARWVATGTRWVEAANRATRAVRALSVESMFADPVSYLWATDQAARLVREAARARALMTRGERLSPTVRPAMATTVDRYADVTVTPAQVSPWCAPQVVTHRVPTPWVNAGHAVRVMGEAETMVAARPTSRADRTAPYAGEGDDRVSTAPNVRDVNGAGVLGSFKAVVSPRKKGGGQTGPTIPARF